ncbi:MAG TPA: VapE domain-containing protein [Archangium sp.]|jgi:predicted P-loop ATPase|uniref:VapE domain-containing protein n=1 Tax=Archangium sp. TaxID=1872627 RepID=UPI002EDB2966
MSAPELSPVVAPEPTAQYAEELQERIDPQDVTRPVPLAPSPAVTLELLSTPPSAEKLAQVVAGLAKRFFHRQDVLNLRTFQGKPHPGVLDDEDTLLDAVRAHVLGPSRNTRQVRIYLRNRDGSLGKTLDGHFRLGAYQLAQDSTVAWLCIDFDAGHHHHALVDPLAAALQAHDKAQRAGLPCYLERSGGGYGWHLWVFFADPVAAQVARSLGLLLAPDDAPCVKGGVADPVKGHGIEVFPKQAQLPPGGLGNMVWLPLWSEAAEGANHFYRPGSEGRLVQYLPEDFDCATMEQLERALAEVVPSFKTQATLRKESPRGGVLPAAVVTGTQVLQPTQGMHLAAEPASPLQRAVDRYLADHPRFYPNSGGQCPACGHKGCFGQLADNPRRWSCFSASHDECRVGRKGSTCWFGDALDLDAAAAGVDRMDLLRQEGYLDDEGDEPEDGTTHSSAPRLRLASNNTGLASSGSPSPARIRPGTGRPKVYKAKTYATCCDIIRNNAANVLEGELEYNEMLLTPTIDRKVPPTSIVGILRERIELRLTPPKKKGKKPPKKLTFSEAQVTSALLQVAEEQSYHPVRDYLEGLVWDGVERIKDVAPVLLGIADPDLLTQAILRRFFISAVARPLEPGCKVDTVLVLVGAQGARKSSFFKALAGPEWFSDSAVDLKNKDSLMLMRRIWFHEWAELETMRKSEATQVKAHLSSAVDMLRPAYGRRIEEFPRTSIIVASTNIPAFLNDETGSRRFWVVSGCTRIDVEKTRQWRDQLWAEAVVLYRAGEQWWLTPEEDALRAARNAEHEQEDIWADKVLEAVVHRLANHPEAPITTQLLLEEHLGKQTKDWTQADQKRVAGILQRLGFTEKRKRVDGQRLSTWTPPSAILDMAAERRERNAKAMREVEEAVRHQQEALKAKKNVDDADFS